MVGCLGGCAARSSCYLLLILGVLLLIVCLSRLLVVRLLRLLGVLLLLLLVVLRLTVECGRFRGYGCGLRG